MIADQGARGFPGAGVILVLAAAAALGVCAWGSRVAAQDADRAAGAAAQTGKGTDEGLDAESGMEADDALLLQEDGGEAILDLSAVDTSSVRPLQIHGRFDVVYAHFEHGGHVEDFPRNGFLVVEPAILVSYRFFDQFRIEFDIEWEGVNDAVEVERGFLEWAPFGQLLAIQIGRKMIPFGAERFFHPPTRNDLIDRPAPFVAVYPGTFPDDGIFLEGEWDHEDGWKLGYELGVSYGLHSPDRFGSPGDFTDNNDSKRLTGRLAFSPVKGLTAGASWSSGQYDRNDSLTADFTGVDLQYEFYGIGLRGEWVGGMVEQPGRLGGTFHRHGWYVQVDREWDLPWRYPRAFETVFRFDSIDPNNDIRDANDFDRYAFGFNLVISDYLRWKIEFEITDERHDDVSNDGVLTQIDFHW